MRAFACDVRDDDRRAGGRELSADRGAQAAATAGHDDDRVAERTGPGGGVDEHAHEASRQPAPTPVSSVTPRGAAIAAA